MILPSDDDNIDDDDNNRLRHGLDGSTVGHRPIGNRFKPHLALSEGCFIFRFAPISIGPFNLPVYKSGRKITHYDNNKTNNNVFWLFVIMLVFISKMVIHLYIFDFTSLSLEVVQPI